MWCLLFPLLSDFNLFNTVKLKIDIILPLISIYSFNNPPFYNKFIIITQTIALIAKMKKPNPHFMDRKVKYTPKSRNS
jgi:hypothetical protein